MPPLKGGTPYALQRVEGPKIGEPKHSNTTDTLTLVPYDGRTGVSGSRGIIGRSRPLRGA